MGNFMHDAVGRTQSTTDIMDPARAAAMQAALGLEGAPPGEGDPVLPFGHRVYFWTHHHASDLGPDGHPKLGGFIPDLGLPNRMWAGGRLRFLNPLCLGTRAERTTTIERVDHKTGRSGAMAFVTLRHEITQGGRLAITEWQDLVYRGKRAKSAFRPDLAPTDPDHRVAIRFPETMLQRYSALMFNAHRIHYDQAFVRREFGFPAVVVHGPLLAQFLMLMAQQQIGVLKSFDFRATAPLLAGEAGELCWRSDGTAWVSGPKGRLIMQSTAA